MNQSQDLQTILTESEDPGNPDPETLQAIMEKVKTIAVVGISRNPEKPARRVPSYLAAQGYEVVPVNPFVDRILGREARDSLQDVEEAVDMVLVFRPSEEAARIMEAAMARAERPVIWLQEGIRDDAMADKARKDGLLVVQNMCAFKVHQALKKIS